MKTMPTWPFMWRLITYARRPFSLHAALQIFFLGSRVLPGLVEKAVFDKITGAAPVALNLWALLALYAGIGLARMVATYAETWFGWTFRFTAAALLRRNLFAAHLRRPGATPQPVAPGEAVNRYRNDVGEVCDFPTWLPDVAGTLISFVIAVTIMASINWRVTLFVFLPLVVAYGIGRSIWGKMLHYRREQGLAEDAVTGFLAELFGAVQAIKVAGAETHTVAHFRRLAETRSRTAIRTAVLEELAYSMNSIAVVVGVGVMLLLAGQAMTQGAFTVGDFALFTYYLWFTTELPSYLGSFVGDIKQQEVAISRLVELVPDEPPEVLVEHHAAWTDTPPYVMLSGLTSRPQPRRNSSEASPSPRDPSLELSRNESRVVNSLRVTGENRSPFSKSAISPAFTPARTAVCEISASPSLAGASWSSPGRSARARRRCCAPYWACCRAMRAKSCGTASRWPTRPRCWRCRRVGARHSPHDTSLTTLCLSRKQRSRRQNCLGMPRPYNAPPAPPTRARCPASSARRCARMC